MHEYDTIWGVETDSNYGSCVHALKREEWTTAFVNRLIEAPIGVIVI